MPEIQDIKTVVDIDEAFKADIAVIFKNSTACAVSATARREFRKFSQSCSEHIKLYMVDVILNRQLSGEIADRTGIRHESPQIIVLKNGAVVWNASHWSIKTQDIIDAVES